MILKTRVWETVVDSTGWRKGMMSGVSVHCYNILDFSRTGNFLIDAILFIKLHNWKSETRPTPTTSSVHWHYIRYCIRCWWHELGAVLQVQLVRQSPYVRGKTYCDATFHITTSRGTTVWLNTGLRGRGRSKRDGTRWCVGGEVKGK